MTATELQQWRLSRGLSRRQAAEQLGLSERALQDRENGNKPVRRETDLACAALSLSLRGWSEYPR